MSNEFGYIPESPEQSFGNNKGIFTPKDIYDLTRADKYTNYGQLELIETQTYSSGVAYIDFTSINGTNYNVHFLTFNGLSTTVAGVSLFSIRYSTDGGSSFVSSGYQNAYQDGISSGSFNENRSTSESGLRIGFSYSTTLTSGYVYLYNLRILDM